jgi:ATP/maltotriose-dependent transcriptional regulator MalT
MPRQKAGHVPDPAAAGRRLKEARLRNGLSQRELAFAGCTAAYISRVEAGDRIPSFHILRELGQRLGVSAEYLATGRDPDTGPDPVTEAELSLRLGDVDEAETRFQALAESRQRTIRARALGGLGQIALERGDVEAATQGLREAVELLGDSAWSHPSIVEALARAYSVHGDLVAARTMLERVSALAQEDESTRFRLRVLLANVLIDSGDFTTAEQVLASLPVEESERNPIALAKSLWSRSRLSIAKGNAELAASLAHQALALVELTERDDYIARARQLLAYIELERGNGQRALELLAEARPAIEAAGDRTQVALLSVEEARALLQVGDLEAARRSAELTLSHLSELSAGNAARCYGVLAEVFARLGEPDRALQLYQDVTELLAPSGNPMLANLYASWSHLLEEMGDTEAALRVAYRALELRSGVRR